MEASPSPGLEAAAPQLSPIEAQAVLSSDTSFALSDPVLGLSLSQQQEQQQAQPTTTLEVVDPAALQGEFLVPFTGAPAGELATAASSSSNSAGAARGESRPKRLICGQEVGIKVNGNTEKEVVDAIKTLIAEFRHKQRQALRQGDPQVARRVQRFDNGIEALDSSIVHIFKNRQVRINVRNYSQRTVEGELCTIDYFVDDAYLLGDIEFGSPELGSCYASKCGPCQSVCSPTGKAMRLRLQPGESWTGMVFINTPSSPSGVFFKLYAVGFIEGERIQPHGSVPYAAGVSQEPLFISSKITRGIKKRRRELEQGAPGGSQASAGSQSQSQDLDDPDYEGDENLSWIREAPARRRARNQANAAALAGALPAPPSQEQSGELAASGTQGDDPGGGSGMPPPPSPGPSSQASVVERSQSSRGGRGGGGAGAHAGRTALVLAAEADSAAVAENSRAVMRMQARVAGPAGPAPAHPYFLSLEFSHFSAECGGVGSLQKPETRIHSWANPFGTDFAFRYAPKEPGWYCIRGSLFAALDGSPSIASSTLWLPFLPSGCPENRRAKEILRAYEIDQHAAACLAMQLGEGAGRGSAKGGSSGGSQLSRASSSASSGAGRKRPAGAGAGKGDSSGSALFDQPPIVSGRRVRRKSAKLAEAEAMEEGDGDDVPMTQVGAARRGPGGKGGSQGSPGGGPAAAPPAPPRPRPAPAPAPPATARRGGGGEEAARDLGEGEEDGEGPLLGAGPAGGVRVKREEGAEEGEGGARGAPSASALDPDGALLPVAASPGGGRTTVAKGADALLAIARLHSQ
eukprot:tig00021493_g21852.t1